LKKQLKGSLEGKFEFRFSRNGTIVVQKETVAFSTVRSHFENNNFPYFTRYSESQKPIKAVIRHLQLATPAEDISDGLVNLSSDVISVKQMSATRRSSADGTPRVNLPLFLINLPRTSKFQGIFKLTSL
jgi:hypothetical protein